jgi:pyruvate,water dikinase
MAAYLERFGDEAPVWDVAVPTYREDPSRLASLAARRSPGSSVPAAGGAPAWQRTARETAASLAPHDRAAFAALLDVARRARAVGEDDDWLYARVQAAVRAGLLREGERLLASGALQAADDVFWLPFERVRALAAGEATAAPDDLRAQVAKARADHARALRDPPELGGGNDRRSRSGRAGGLVVSGLRAAAGRVLGRAFVYRPASPGANRAPDPGAIVVAATLLPTELPLLPAAGLVVEIGGVLDHVAAQARERGIPAIVGAHGACAAIANGDLVLLDADAGHLIRLESGLG